MNTAHFVKDPRYFQIIFQGLFLSYGIFYLGWAGEQMLYASYFFAALLTQLAGEALVKNSTVSYLKRIARGLPSVAITAFGLCLLLKTNSAGIAAMASVIAIASKYLIKINGRHVFNPSALGIAAVIFFTGNAWINAGQWGNTVVLFFAVITLGVIITSRVQKLDVSLAFLVTYASLLFCRQVLFLGWPVDFFLQSVSTGSLLIFSFFMISDPKTIPAHKTARIVWSIFVALLAFCLGSVFFVNGAPVFALILAQPFVPLINKICKAQAFQWQREISIPHQQLITQ